MPDTPIETNPIVSNTSDPQAAAPQSSTAPAQPSTTPSADSQTGQAQSPTNQAPSTPPVSSTTVQPSAAPQIVTNAPTTTPAQNQSVQRAGVLRTIAQTLAGGPRYKTTIDPTTGATQRTQVPLSRADIGMAIVSEVLSGAMSGLSVPNGPGNLGRAAAAGFQNAQTQRQHANQAQEVQAQADLKNQTTALARQASIYETNSRSVLNVAQAQRLGQEAVSDLVAINRASGVLDVDPAYLENNGEPMTEDAVLAGMRDGSINSTSHLGPVAGYTLTPGQDGKTQLQTTHLVVKDANTPVTMTPELWKTFSDADIPGYPKGSTIPENGVQVPLRIMQNANEKLAERKLTDYKLDDLRSTLAGTDWASKVPAKVDFSQPGVDRAMTALARYQSHDDANAADPFLALQQMGTAKRDPKTGNLSPNSDARYADTIAQQLGGWPLLLAAHNQLAANAKSAEQFAVIDSEAKAEAVLSAPKGRFSQAQLSAASNFVQLTQRLGAKKAVATARADAQAKGSDVQAMYRYGTNPITGEKLTLQNAPNGFLVDPDGNVVSQSQQALYKPTAQQKQTADTARQVLAISSDLQSQVAKNPAIIGALSGNSAKAFAPFGIGTEAGQKMLDNVSLLQSAITKMHTGRFSSEILKKSGSLIFPGMNTDQFAGAMDSLKDVAGRYANEDQLQTVANFKQQQAASTTATRNGGQNGQPQMPAGATMKVPGSDGKLHWSDGKRDMGVIQ